MLSQPVKVVQDGYTWRSPVLRVSQRASVKAYDPSYLEWNLVKCPDLSAKASFVSMSSQSILAISITISSTSQSSYFIGRTFAGGESGLTRLGLPMEVPSVAEASSL